MEYHTEERKKKEFLSVATASVELDNIILTEVSQSVKEKYHVIQLIRGM